MELDRRRLLRWMAGTALAGSIPPLLTACGSGSKNYWPVVKFPRGIHYGPYVVHPTRDGITVLWRSTEPVRGGLRYVGAPGQRPRELREVGSRLDHEITIRGLEAGCAYQILHDGRAVGAFHPCSPIGSDPDRPLRFAIIGDSGSGCPAQFDVGRLLHRSAPDFVLHVGDVVYSRPTPDRIRARHFWPFRNVIDRTPLYPAWGNHDVRPRYYELIKRALRAPDFYAFRRRGCLFVCLNSVLPIGEDSEQLRWFEQELQASQDRWKFVAVHNPPYASRQSIGAPDLSALLRLFDAYEVDMVFSGDAHFYERTVPIRGGKQDNRGTVYITTGGGGGELYPLMDQPLRAAGESVHHAVFVEIVDDRLELEAVKAESSMTFDSVVIRKSR